MNGFNININATLDPSGIIDDYASFEEYFDSTIAYTRQNLAVFESGAYRL